MAGKIPDSVMEVGRLIDLGVIELTDVAIPVPSTITCMAVSVQAEPDNTVDVLVGDETRQSRRLAARDVYAPQVGTANNVWMRADGIGETASVNVHLLVPPGAR